MPFALLEDMFRRNGALHHGYALVGNRAESRRRLERFLNDLLSFPIAGNPDFHEFDSPVLTIDDARMIRETALRRAFGERSIFVVSCDTLTREAGNALLKTLEEPAPHTHFFIIVPSAEALLPTLRSRLSVISVTGGAADDFCAESETVKRAEEFLRGTCAERFACIRELREENESKEGSRTDTREFLAELERQTHASLHSGGDAPALTALLLAHRYRGDRGASEKLLLEHLAVALPRKVQ